jgi:hypothetical protein
LPSCRHAQTRTRTRAMRGGPCGAWVAFAAGTPPATSLAASGGGGRCRNNAPSGFELACGFFSVFGFGICDAFESLLGDANPLGPYTWRTPWAVDQEQREG